MADSGRKSVYGSPDWLPAGWVEQHKALRSGREVKCYLNVDTMQKFFSKEDVLNFVTKESCSVSNSQPNNQLIISCEGKDQIAANNTDGAEENPDWLPNGWITELKFRISGQRSGGKYNIYVDPSTGHRFYSKPEVLRHLKTIKSNNCSTHEETGSGMQPCRNRGINTPTDRATEPHSETEATQRLDIDNCTESLPNQTKDNAALSCDINTPTDRVTRPHFEAETTQCLEIENCTESLPNQNNSTLTACNVLACVPDMEGLPPGWIKEKKARKNGSTVKSDPFYIDPVSGYMFRSKKDVFRYLESGDIRSCKIRPKKKEFSDPVSSDGQTSPFSGGGAQLTEAAPGVPLFTDKNISDVSNIALPKSRRTKKRPSEQMSADSVATKVDSPQKKASLEIVNGNCSKSDNICDISALTSSKSEVYARNGSMGVNKSRRRGGPNLPCRASKRLAGLKPELLADSASGKEAHSATRQYHKSKANELGQSASNMLEDVGSKQPFAGPEVELTHHASDADIPFCGQPTLRKKSSLEGQLTKEEQLRELETNDVDDSEPIPKFVNQFSNSSSDPCLKFSLDAARSEISKGDVAIDKPSSILVTDIPQERNTVSKRENNRRGKASTKSTNAKRKEPKLPSQSSKRLTNFQPYEEVNLSTEQAIQFDSRNSSNNGAHLDAPSIGNGNADVASQKLPVFCGTGLANQGFIDLNGVSPESSNRCFESPALFNMQRQEMEAFHLHGKAKSGLTTQLGDSWTDPCLEFAIKTLTGAIPVPETVGHGLSSPAPNVLKQNLVDGRTKKSNKVESNRLKNKNKLVLPCHSSEEVAKVKREKVDSSGSVGYATSGSAFRVDTGLFHDNIFDRPVPNFEAAPPTMLAGQVFSHDNIPLRQEATNNILNHERRNLFDSAIPNFDVAAPTALANQVSSHNNIPLWPESSHNTLNLERQSAPGPGEQLQKQESMRMSLENLDSQFFLPFGEPWYDPCLEFAFKTLTGAIPVDDNLAVQDYLSQHQLGTMQQPHRDFAPLPDFNLPTVPQDDESKHFGASDKNVFRQQQPLQSPIYTPANVGTSSQHTWQEADKRNVKF